jgi:hypothetical protein
LYNQVVRFSILAPVLLAALTLLSGCRKDIQNKEAVRQGVLSYLAKRSDLTAMDVAVSTVSFHKDEANATVHFQAKGSPDPGAGMEIKYILERKGDQWVVKGRSSMAGSGHGTPAGGDAGQLPPGHPTVPGASPALPPGHPPLGQQPPAK